MNHPLGNLPRFVLIATVTVFFVCSVGIAQTPTFGVKVGIPILQPFLQNGSPFGAYSFTTPRLVIGPTVGLSLTDNLDVEANALWRRLRYETTSPVVATTANSWEFPFLLRASLPGEAQPMFGDIGFAFRHAGGTTQLTNTLQRDPPLELVNRWSGGLVVGGGLSLGVHAFHFLPEVRYTRWRTPSFSGSGGLFSSNLNQVDLIFGFDLRPH
jgi:hypothetical protein